MKARSAAMAGGQSPAQQAQSDRATADAALQKLIDENAVSGPFQIATVYGLRKEPDKMFEWLERAYTEHDPGLTQLLGTPFILNYRDDARFAAFCQKLKVPVPTAAPGPSRVTHSSLVKTRRATCPSAW